MESFASNQGWKNYDSSKVRAFGSVYNYLFEVQHLKLEPRSSFSKKHMKIK